MRVILILIALILLNASFSVPVDMLRRLIGEDIDLVFQPEPGLEYVKGDAGQVEQVITNLAINARDAMPDGGELTIRTENTTVNEDYCASVPFARIGEFVCISITDTGVAIDKTVIDKIFEPFFSTKKSGEGTGLGLAVVYGIVKQHQGWITVASEPGEGTIFRIYLPAIPPMEEEEPAQFVVDGLEGNGERIMIVEDDELVSEFISKVLRANGYAVFEARDAGEAMKKFEAESRDFDLIFIDMVLSDQTGLKLGDWFISRMPGIKVLFSSGYTDRRSRWLAVKKKGYRFIQKPFSRVVLLRYIRMTIEESPDEEAKPSTGK